jgi:hypothetical protein
MFKLIIQILLAILLFRIIGSAVGWLRGKSGAAFKEHPQNDPVDAPDYSEITPYDIEDAEFEELPKQK